MNSSSPASPETVGSASRDDLSQHSGLLRCTRLVCIVVNTLALALFVVTFPTYVAHVQTPCTVATCSFGQLSQGAAHALVVSGFSLHAYAVLVATLVISATLLCAALAALLLFRKANTRMALLAAVLLVFLATSNSTTDASVLRPWLGALLSVPVAGICNYLGAIAFPVIFALFPTGQFVPGFLRWLVLVQLLMGVVFTFPFSPPTLVLLFSTFVWVSCLLSLVGAQIYRYRRISTAVERQQTKWVIFGFSLALLIALLLLLPALLFPLLRQPDSPYFTIWQLIATFLLTFALAVSLGLALLRYRLWDIDLIINRTLVYGLLTASILSLYVLLVTALGAALRAEGNLLISLCVTGLVAVLFQPLRVLLQRGVNRLLYGQRDEPYAVIARLSQRLKETLAPDAVLSTIVETVAQALKLPYVALLWKQEEVFELAASYGRPVGEPFILPLVYQAEMIGQLQLAPRSPGEAFTPADRRLLDELARQAGLAAHAVRLATDLQHARERLVLAREEERRRLRRDLHDGVGPTLASLSQRIDTACHLIPDDPDAAMAQLRTLKTQVKSAIADIRRVVYALRPPILDELGLTSAIREHAMQFHGGNGLRVSVETPVHLPPLPAAVEVATYRIALEALTNVERHAHAQHCLVCLDLVDEHVLCLSILDDGCGLPGEYRAGVGITSLRERVAELGGSCTIGTTTEGGTRVDVRLPLKSERGTNEVERKRRA